MSHRHLILATFMEQLLTTPSDLIQPRRALDRSEGGVMGFATLRIVIPYQFQLAVKPDKQVLCWVSLE